jgi:hypothetical protein
MRTGTIFAAMVLMAACGKRDRPAGSSDAAARGAGAAVAASSGRGPAGARVDFAVQSDIPGCLSVARKDTIEQGNLLLARIETKTTHISAECGCTSRWLLYRSVAEREGIETELASGSLLAGTPGGPSVERLVVLLTERAHPPTDGLVLHVGCAPAP